MNSAILKAPALALILFTVAPGSGICQLTYPHTRKTSQVDDYFGTKVADPYRWLENDTSSETKQWVSAQRDFTDNYLKKIPFRDGVRERYREIVNYPRYSSAFKVGSYIFYTKNDGLQNQPVYYYQEGLGGSPKLFLDPNKMSKDGTVSIDLGSISTDKKYMAFYTHKGGSDWKTIQVIEVATRRILPDTIEWVKFSSAAWYKDGFFYSRYEQPKSGTELTAASDRQKIYYHKLGDKQGDDKAIYESTEGTKTYISTTVTDDERYLLLYKDTGGEGNEYWYRNLTTGQENFLQLCKKTGYNYYFIDNTSSGLLIHTDDGAGRYRVVLIDPSHPEKSAWKEIIPEAPEKLEDVSTCGGKIFAVYLKDASTRIYQFNLDGTAKKEVKLPGLGTASGISGFKRDTIAFYNYSSFTDAPCVYWYNIPKGASGIFKKSEIKLNTSDYTTEQVFFSSKDGTMVPMFLVHKKGLPMDGQRPTLLYGYGGFEQSMRPYFQSSIYILLEQGGIYAYANLRGGGEYGEQWHKAGRLLNKQNVFDDFIAAANYLVAHHYTNNELLAARGGSNGGLLIGATMVQQPSLFKVAIPEVGVMDMLRFQKFTVGWHWVKEYGSSDSARYFPCLYKYSPLHNIKEGVAYPATLVLTADHDDRVVPAHSFKFAATLQEKQQGKAPILIRIAKAQGHGAGASLDSYIDEVADIWSFVFYQMGINPKF